MILNKFKNISLADKGLLYRLNIISKELCRLEQSNSIKTKQDVIDTKKHISSLLNSTNFYDCYSTHSGKLWRMLDALYKKCGGTLRAELKSAKISMNPQKILCDHHMYERLEIFYRDRCL